MIPFNKVLLRPIEGRIKLRCCVDGVDILNKFCIRFSAENDPESEEDEGTVTNFLVKKTRRKIQQLT
jgi:hypothetical protein